MCAAWKKKNERNEIVCFYCTQSEILLCGIARFSRRNKSKLRTFQPQKWKKIKNSQPQTKFAGCYKKKRLYFKKSEILFSRKQQGTIRTGWKIYSCIFYYLCIMVTIFQVATSLSIFSTTIPSLAHYRKQMKSNYIFTYAKIET